VTVTIAVNGDVMPCSLVE